MGQLFKLKNKAESKEDLLFSYVYFKKYLGKSRPQERLDTRHAQKLISGSGSVDVPRAVLDPTAITAVAIVHVNYKFDHKRASLP